MPMPDRTLREVNAEAEEMMERLARRVKPDVPMVDIDEFADPDPFPVFPIPKHTRGFDLVRLIPRDGILKFLGPRREVLARITTDGYPVLRCKVYDQRVAAAVREEVENFGARVYASRIINA